MALKPRLLSVLFAALCGSLSAGAAPAPPKAPVTQTSVDVALVLAVDASGSIDDDRFNVQKLGYAAAFRNPKVLQAIQSGGLGAIAVTMMQWTGPSMRIVAVPWMLIKDQVSAHAAADAILRAPRQLFGGGTSLSGGIDGGVVLLTASPYKATKRVIDISGDGSNNRGRDPTEARDAAVQAGIRINGLPITALEPDLDLYYRQNVIGGPGAFVIAVKNYDAFAAAILRKLITEISADPPALPKLALVPVSAPAGKR